MDTTFLIARVVHIVLGVFWVGTLIFNVLFLFPSIREAGPEGMKVGAALMRRGFMTILPVTAILTLITGFWMYWRVSAGFEPSYMGSPAGMVFGTGGVTALLAFLLGVAVMRPSMLKAGALTQASVDAAAEEREAMLAKAAELRRRGLRAAQIVAVLLLITTITMALGRYAGA